jgi:RHS repeat-associated protein
MRGKKRRLVKQLFSYLLCVSMVAPNMTPIVSFGAEYMNNRPRYVDFASPEVLTLEELGLDQNETEAVVTEDDSSETAAMDPSDETNTAETPEVEESNEAEAGPEETDVEETSPTEKESGTEETGTEETGKSDSGPEGTKEESSTSLPEESEKIDKLQEEQEEAREPELYYDYDQYINEPEGQLVQFNESYRTYRTGEGQYVTVAGGYSGLYQDENGVIGQIDNSLTETEEEYTIGTPSSALLRSRTKTVAGYGNSAGRSRVLFPEKFSTSQGVSIEREEHRVELIPSGGSFKKSAVSDNTIRYSDVYPGVDYQYSLVGNTLKEDIILLEKTERNQFSFSIKAGGLKAVQEKNTIILYSDNRRHPEFILEAPLMIDADGNTSEDLVMKLSGVEGSYRATVTADKKWLQDEDRSYPVRIDPSAVNMVPSEFVLVNVADGQPSKFLGNMGPMYAGYREGFGNMRTYVAINGDWTQVMGQAVCTKATFRIGTQTGNGVGNTRIELRAPGKEWNATTLTWNQLKEPLPELIDVLDSPGPDQTLEYDITAMMQSWMTGSRLQAGLELQAANEPKSEAQAPLRMPAESFYNRDNAAMGPRIDISWEGELLGDLALLDVGALTVQVNPAVKESESGGRTSMGVLAHGISQAGSKVTWELREMDHEVSKDEVTAEDSYTSPDFSKEVVFTEAINSQPKTGNWQSKALEKGLILKTDTIYQVMAVAEGVVLEEDPETGEMVPGVEIATSKEKPSDKFLLYEVQSLDLLTRIADHYEVEEKTIRKDNHLSNGLTFSGDILFIRNPQQNTPYTPKPLTDAEQMMIDMLLNGMGKDCVFSHEPINMNTGDFYMQQTDAELEELGGSFAFQRSYNSIAAHFISEFGIGWSSPFGQRLTVRYNGDILYRRDDGGAIHFAKQSDGSYQAPDGYDMVLLSADSIDLETADIPSEEEEEGTPSETGNKTYAHNFSILEAGLNQMTEDDETEEEAEEAEEEVEEEAEEEEDNRVPEAAAWELKKSDGTVLTFDARGLLRYVTDRKGYRTVLLYDENDDVRQIRTPSGKIFDLTADEYHRITSVTLPNGGIITYGYDESHNLISVTDPEGGGRRYEYDDAHHMTAWYDENGSRIVENIYDKDGRVTSQTDALGNIVSLAYENSCTVSTDNRGNVTRYYMDSRRRISRIEYPDGSGESTAYTEDNRVASRTDENGVTTSYTYDKNGNIQTETRGDGSQASYTYNDLNLPLTASDYEGNVTTFTYDESGNLLSMTDGEGNTVHYTYDELNRMVSIKDANGGTHEFTYVGAVVASMTDGEGYIWTFAYDDMNHVLEASDPLGNTKSYEYNLKGWRTSETEKDGGTTKYEFDAVGTVLSITDAMDEETAFTYDKMYNILSGRDALGNTLDYVYDENYNKIKERDAKGGETHYTYDSRNRLIKTTDVLGQEIAYELDGKGNILKTTDRRGNIRSTLYHTILNLPVLKKDALGNETYYSYDRNGNLKKVTYPDGTSISYTYDRAGRMVSTTAQNGLVTKLSYDGNGNIIRINDDETRVYQFKYDLNNRIVSAEDPLGGITLYSYDGAGNQKKVTDAESNATGYAYDAAGRLKEVTDALNGTVTAEYDLNGNTLKTTDQNGTSTSYHYDVIGQVLAEVDAAGFITAMEYDSLGNVEKVTDALKGETSMEMDALSRTTRMTDAMGHEYKYTYDANGNVIRVLYPDGDSVVMVYDANDRMIKSIDEADVITSYTYDPMGRIIEAKDNIGNTMTYEYDESGNLVKQTDTIGRSAVYEYDKFNHLISVTGTDLATTRYGYDALDRLTEVTDPEGKQTSYEYDKVGNLVKTRSPGEAVYTYAYDAINRLTKKVNPLGAATTFQYDAKGNLTGTVDGEGAENSYVYDATNRLTTFIDGRGNGTAYEYDELSRLLSYTTAEGNKQEYRYDADSNLTKVKDANGLITEYQYDVMGNLVKTISPKGAVTAYTYDKHDEVTSITDPTGNVTAYEVDLNRQVLSRQEKNGGTYSYSYDVVHRLTGVKTPLGLSRSFTYDVADNIVTDTDTLGRTNAYTYDIMHRMTKAVDAKGGETVYGYDVRGNRNAVTDALGYTWNYRYDKIDQLTASVDPEGKATEVVYNLVGEIASVTKPGERTTSFAYDKNYNRTAITDPKGYIYEYTYDKDNRLTDTKDPLAQTEQITYDKGSRVTSVKDKMGLTESYTYDPHGNILSVQATNGLMTRFSYDILDNLVKVTMPSNLTTTYDYDVMGNVTAMTDTMNRTTAYTYDLEGNMTSLVNAEGRKEQSAYDAGGRMISHTTNSGDTIRYDYDKLNDLVEKSYEGVSGESQAEGVLYGYDALGQRVSMMDTTGESTYEYDSLERITKVTSGSGQAVTYTYDGADQLEGITYPDGKSVYYQYDKNDNITGVVGRDGKTTAYTYDAINRVTEIHRPNGINTYNTYNARDQIVAMKNVCDDCGWVVSEYQYTYDDRGFIVGEDVLESLYAYAWDDKHDGRHENGKHDTQYPHGDTHNNKHDKDAKDNYQIIGTKRTFEYDDDGKLLKATEEEERQGTYVYTYRYDDMGNRTFYSKTRNGTVIESAEYTYNASNQKISAKLYDGKKNTTMKYEYDADGNLISETGKKGTDKVELTYDYTVENRLKAVFDADELLVAAAYDGDGNRLFQLNYNLHTDDDWKGNSGNGNGNNKDNSGSGNNGNSGISGVISEALSSVVDFFTGTVVETAAEPETEAKSNGNKNKDKGNDGNATNNGKGNGNGKDNSSGNNGNNSNSGNNGNGNSGNNGNNGNNGNGNNNGNTGTGSTNNGSDTANGSGNTNNTGGSENQSGILMPKKPVSDVEQGLIDLIKTTGKHKNYELIEYVNDVNREYTEVLMEVNIDGEMDTAYTYGNKRLALERFTSWTGYYTNDPRGSVTGVTGSEGTLWKSYRYSPTGDITFGKPEYNNAYSYNAEDYNPNLEFQYLRARYYDVERGDFVTEDTYLGNITDPLTLNRYNYVKSSAPNYVDSSGHMPRNILNSLSRWYNAGIIEGKGLSTLTLLLNGMGVETALHEIAQLNMAKDLYTRGYSPKLEVEIFAPSLKKKIYNASDASRANNCTWQEIDIVAKGYIWEIKSIGQVLTPSKLGSAEKQLDNYLTAGQDIYQEGTREIFSGITGVEVLGDIKMNVKPTLKRSGVIEYDFYKDDDGERVTVVSFSAVREQYKKRQKEALEAIGGIMILTILEDIISVGAGTLDDLPSFLVALGRATVILATP